MTPLVAVLALALAATTAASTSDGLSLQAQKPVTRSIDAFPRITAPATPETAAINTLLDKADERVRNAGRVCKQSDPDHGAWNRTVTAPFNYGPYLTLMAADESYCGGGTVEAFNLPLTFDLKTGAAIDWTTQFPDRFAGLPTTAPAGDASTVDELLSPILGEVYRRKALRDMDADARVQCTDPMQRPLAVMLWLDAEREAVVMRTTSLPRAAAACAVEVTLSTTELGQLSASPALIDALKAAHAAHAWTATFQRRK